MSTAVAETKPRLVAKFAERFSVDPDKLLTTLKSTCFKVKDGEVSNEQMMALLVVADQYNLNPFTKEIFAFPDKQNGIVPVVSVDGWTRIINERPQYDGVEFRYSEKLVEPAGGKQCPEWCEALVYRKDRSRPIVVREYLDEVYRPAFEGTGKNGQPYKVNGAWQSHTKRFLRHKTLIQCSRIAFGFAGIYDEDEAERIEEARLLNPPEPGKPTIQMPTAKSSVVEGEFTEVKTEPKGAAPSKPPADAASKPTAPEPAQTPPPEANTQPQPATEPTGEVVTPAMAKMIRASIKEPRTEQDVAAKFGVVSVDDIRKGDVNAALKFARSGE